MNIMRGVESPVNTKKEVLNERTLMRNMLGKVRYQNENFGQNDNKATPSDQRREEEKFLNNFRDDEVNTNFQDIEIYNDKVFWGGTTETKNGSIDWIYKVSDSTENSGFIPNEDSNFDVTIPENKQVMDKLRVYYDEFYKYWRDNELQGE